MHNCIIIFTMKCMREQVSAVILQSPRCIRVINFWHLIFNRWEKHLLFTSWPVIKKGGAWHFLFFFIFLKKTRWLLSHYFSSFSRKSKQKLCRVTFWVDVRSTRSSLHLWKWWLYFLYWAHLDSAWILAVCLSSSSASFFFSRSVSCLRPAECSISPSRRLRRDLWNTQHRS